MRFEFTLNGLCPLLMNYRNIDFEDDLAAWIGDKANAGMSKPGDDRTPSWTWQGRVYTNGVKIAFPQDNIMSCLKAAGSKIPAKRGNYSKATQAFLMVTDEHCEFVGAKGEILCADYKKFTNEPFSRQRDLVTDLGFSLMTKNCVNPSTRKANVRVRPRFDRWAIRGMIDVRDTNQISPDRLREIFDVAGNMIGLGDWRPGPGPRITPGPYGRFEAKLRQLKLH